MVYCNAVDLNRWMSGKNNYIGFSVTSNTCLAIDHVREENVNTFSMLSCVLEFICACERVHLCIVQLVKLKFITVYYINYLNAQMGAFHRNYRGSAINKNFNK